MDATFLYIQNTAVVGWGFGEMRGLGVKSFGFTSCFALVGPNLIV